MKDNLMLILITFFSLILVNVNKKFTQLREDQAVQTYVERPLKNNSINKKSKKELKKQVEQLSQFLIKN